MKSNTPQHDWLDTIAQKAQEAEHPVPNGVWEGIASQMVQHTPSSSRGENNKGEARRSKIWPWIAAAAAAAIAALILLPPFSSHRLPVRGSLAEPGLAAIPSQQRDARNHPGPSAASNARLAQSHEAATAHRLQFATQPSLDSMVDIEQQMQPRQESRTSTRQEPSLPADANQQPRTQSLQHPLPHDLAAPSPDPMEEKRLKGLNSNKPSLSVKVHGSGILFAQANGSDIQPGVMLASMSNGSFYSQPVNIKYNYKHKIPLVLGVNIGKRVMSSLTVYTGLTYSSLSSDVTNTMSGERFSQQVQLLGIPMGMKWNFAQWKNLEAYASAEGMGEKIFKGHFGEDKVDCKRIQWSVHASLGAQYKMADHIGLFVEPKISHYFNDLPIQTVREEHPLNINVRFGLSFDF